MQRDIHPASHEVAFTCSCGNVIKINSTMTSEKAHLDVCSKCHPFYTGKQKLVDSGGRLHKFRQKYAKSGAKAADVESTDKASLSTSASSRVNMPTHAGFVAIIGRPNVGKSTLLNALLEKKISITSRKPQTTRHKIAGIKSTEDTQFVFVDTPGIHEEDQRLLNRYLNRAALTALKEVDCIVWLIDARGWCEADDYVANFLKNSQVPLLLVVNKTDKLAKSDDVIPLVATLTDKLPGIEIIPISAKKHFNLDHLEKLIKEKLPENPFFFAKEQRTDRNDYFIASEMIREKLVRTLGDELPYASMVGVEAMQKKGEVLHISATIWVEKDGQKGIVIGKGGLMLKKMGQSARLALEKYFECKVFLQLWVKVKESWSEDERILRNVLK